MDEADARDSDQRALEIGTAVGSAAAGVAVDLLVGGAGGVVAGAAAGRALEQLLGRAVGLRRRQAAAMLDAVAAAAARSLEELFEQISDDPRRLQLFVAAMRAAVETALPAKLRALGRALATGVLATDDAVIDEQRFLVDTLADLEAPHAHVLHRLSIQHPGYGSPVSATGQPQAHGWSPRDLATDLPGLAPVLQPILSVLAGHALILDTGVGTYDYRPGEGGRWILTDYGKRCLAELEAIGREPTAEATG
jgi:hypothetical protein